MAVVALLIGLALWLVAALVGTSIADIPFSALLLTVAHRLQGGRYTRDRLQQAVFLSTVTVHLLGSLAGLFILGLMGKQHIAVWLIGMATLAVGASTSALFATRGVGDFDFKLARLLGNAAGIAWGSLLWTRVLRAPIPSWASIVLWVAACLSTVQFAVSVVYGLALGLVELATKNRTGGRDR